MWAGCFSCVANHELREHCNSSLYQTSRSGPNFLLGLLALKRAYLGYRSHDMKISLTPVARRFLTGLRGESRETRGQQCGTYRMSGKACPSPLVKDLSSHERLRFPWPRKRRASAGLARTLGAFFRARCVSKCLSSASQLGKHGNTGRPFVCDSRYDDQHCAHASFNRYAQAISGEV